ncbi:MAG: DUF2232 domain-containing protein [Mariprofundales bacterium]
MPPQIQFLLTQKLPCAALAFTLFTAMFWLPGMLAGIPLLAVLFSLVAVLAHFATPALFALIQLGGGSSFLLPVALISGVGVAAISDFNLLLAMLFLLLYVAVPAWAVASLRQPGGLARSGQQLAITIFVAVICGLALGANDHGSSMQAYMVALMQPLFASITAQTHQDTSTMQSMLALAAPGLVAVGLWSMWWSAVLGARWIAVRYGFYHARCLPWFHVHFSPRFALLTLLTLVPANLASGDLQFVSIALAILLAGMFAVQGMAVAHLWLKERQMKLMLGVMYFALFFWSILIIPFIMVGLLDTWFNFRRNAIPDDGEK